MPHTLNPRRLLHLFGFALLLAVAPAGYQISRLAQALPILDGELKLSGLSTPADVSFDPLGIPSVTAGNRQDAYRTLGFLHARDRLFQMDVMRRKTAGRLAEIFGSKALVVDQAQRVYPFEQVARSVVNALPAQHAEVLTAYAEGVNAVLASAPELGLEFRALHYRPDPWRPEDSILVALGMFQTLNGFEQEERMLSIMTETLPAEVTAFLTPDTDDDAMPLLGGPASRHPAQAVPTEYYARMSQTSPVKVSVESEPSSLGSNNWAVAGSRTADGRAILANDMHLPLAAPNLWYRAVLHYQDKMLAGVTLPGLPLVVVGSNAHLAWGFTNVDADLLDLVRLEADPADPGCYLTPEGPRPYTYRQETIKVKDAADETLKVQETLFGPVSPKPLLGRSVALHWASLQAETINLKLLEMDAATTLETAIPLFNQAGLPPQNVLLADESGRIAWTYTGFIPVRAGFDGRVSVSWARSGVGWRGYIPPEQLPRLINPPTGLLATANNQTVGKNYPYIISHAFSHSYRAHRIYSVLNQQKQWSERDLLALQLDTVSEFYRFYQTLALDVLQRHADRNNAEQADLKTALEHWNGRMEASSLGIGVLVKWRQTLAEKLFAPLLMPGVAVEPGFSYAWREQETPLRALLNAKMTPTGSPAGWDDFLLDTLAETVHQLQTAHPQETLAQLTWGRINPVAIHHPFSLSSPWLESLLDLPSEQAAACNNFCVKVLNDRHGASERLVISPNHLDDGLFEMPGGQSGHPLSSHYRDQQASWLTGSPAPFLPGTTEHRLTLKP